MGVDTAWYYVGGFGVIAWILFTIFSKLSLGKGQGVVAAVTAIGGLAAAIIAGFYAVQTPIGTVVGAIVSIPLIAFVVFLALLVSIVGLTVAAFVPDKWLPAVSATAGLAAAWILIPSALASAPLPGTWGSAINGGVQWAGQLLVGATAGAWG